MTTQTVEQLLTQAQKEIVLSRNGWSKRNAGLARVAARRAAGMAIRAVLTMHPHEKAGTNFMHHLNYIADSSQVPANIRESAWRLANRPAPEGGYQASDPMPTEPSQDATSLFDWAKLVLGLGGESPSSSSV